MTAQLLDGKKIALQCKQDLKQKIPALTHSLGREPALAVILIGQDPASTVYVNSKHRACHDVGIKSIAYQLPSTTTEQVLLELIQTLNTDVNIDGILVQLPLPKHINTDTVLLTINYLKDIDGFHPYNIGRLAQRHPLFRSCTPMGIMTLLQKYDLPVYGQYAVIIGASNIVGRPMLLELLAAQATVTICNSKTRDLGSFVKNADILVVATGIPDLIDPSWIQSHQIVIDVGIHRDQQGNLRGDLNFSAAQERAAWITPVPGGVGPMTIVSLLQNTVQAAELFSNARSFFFNNGS